MPACCVLVTFFSASGAAVCELTHQHSPAHFTLTLMYRFPGRVGDIPDFDKAIRIFRLWQALFLYRKSWTLPSSGSILFRPLCVHLSSMEGVFLDRSEGVFAKPTHTTAVPPVVLALVTAPCAKARWLKCWIELVFHHRFWANWQHWLSGWQCQFARWCWFETSQQLPSHFEHIFITPFQDELFFKLLRYINFPSWQILSHPAKFKFNPWSNTLWHGVRPPPPKRSSLQTAAYEVLATSEMTAW